METEVRPKAVRFRRPGWRDPRLVVGLALIAVAVTGVAVALSAADRTEPVYAARGELVPGAVIGPDDLEIQHVRVGAGYVRAPQGDPTGLVVTRSIGAGELIPAGALVPRDEFEGRPVAVVVDRPLAPDVQAGTLVDIWVTPETSEPSRRVGTALPVSDVTRAEGAFAAAGETVYVVVETGAVGELLDALAAPASVTVVGAGGAP